MIERIDDNKNIIKNIDSIKIIIIITLKLLSLFTLLLSSYTSLHR